jgi:SAM-dependent methyltransferase
METVEHCEICGGTDFSPLMKARDRLHGVEGEFQLVKCRNCGLVFINPRPDQEEIKRFYPSEYGPHAERPGPSHAHRQSPLRRRIYSLYYDYPPRDQQNSVVLRALLLPVRWVIARNVIPFRGTGKILDIGSGSGSFLASMKELGWDPYGVDISPEAVGRARSLGITMFHGEVQEVPFPEVFFDVITLRAVLEHVHRPVETLREVHRILKDQGVVYVVVPNIASLNFRIFGRFWYALEAPRHLYAYSPRVMRLLAKKTGFEVLSTRFRSSTLGLRASLQYWYDDRRGFRGDSPFRSSTVVRSAGKIWRTAMDLIRLGDTVEYTLAKDTSVRFEKSPPMARKTVARSSRTGF